MPKIYYFCSVKGAVCPAGLKTALKCTLGKTHFESDASPCAREITTNGFRLRAHRPSNGAKRKHCKSAAPSEPRQ